MPDEDVIAAAPPRRLTTILAADIVGYSALSEAAPDDAVALIAELTAFVARVSEDCGGRLFHRAGDGFLCEMPSATAGVRAARAIQRGVAGGRHVALRIGVHTGEVTQEASGDLLGHAVNVAARLQAEAPRGGIVLSAATRALCEAPVPMRRVGDLKLKNMREPVTAFEVAEGGGMSARLGALARTGWVRRNRGALAAMLAAAFVGLTVLAGLAVNDARSARAERVAQARDAALRAEAAALADQLTANESRLLDRDAVERAALSLVSSTDEARAPARALALAGDARGAAAALREAYEAGATGAPPDWLAETALQCGAFAFGQDQAMAQWAYERAYEAMPREPFVLLRLAAIATDRNADEDARSYLSALLALGPEPTYAAEAERRLANLAGERGDYDEAERRLRRALAIARAADLTTQEAAILADLGGIAINRLAVARTEGRPPEERAALGAAAERELQRSLRVFRALRDVDGTVHALGELGRLEFMREESEAAIAFYEESYAIIRARGDLRAITSAAFNLSTAHHQIGDPATRDAYWSEAYDAAERGAVDGMRGLLHVVRAGYRHGEGDAAGACLDLDSASVYYEDGDRNVQAMRSAMMDGLVCPVPARR